MKSKIKTVAEVKNEIISLIGEKIKISINKGRNKIEKYDGEVKSVFENVFVVTVFNCKLFSSVSCTYKDVICGDVKIKKTAP